jgi:hypothetical protein
MGRLGELGVAVPQQLQQWRAGAHGAVRLVISTRVWPLKAI